MARNVFLNTIFFFCILESGLVSAKNIALLIGGSGEDFKEKNFLQPAFETYRKNLQNRGWETTTLFDGTKFPLPESKTATNENIIEQIKNISDQAKPGDQVLLYFNGHGSERDLSDLIREKGHKVLTETPDGISTVLMQKAAEDMAKKGVKVSFVDLSCYSGNSQPERPVKKAPPPYCVVTLASDSYVSICGSNPEGSQTFTDGFVKLPQPEVPVTIEDQYQKARLADSSSANFAQISDFRAPNSQFWKKFLTIMDGDSVSRGDDTKPFPKSPTSIKGHTTSIDDEELVSPSEKIDDKLKNFEDLLKEFNRNVPAFDEKTKSELTKLFNTELAPTFKELTAVTKELNDLFSRSVNWDDNVPNISLGMMNEIVEILESKTPISDIAWLGSSEKEVLETIRPKLEMIKKQKGLALAAVNKAMKKYEELSKKINKQVSEIMKLERQEYNKSLEIFKDNRDPQDKDQRPCQNFSL